MSKEAMKQALQFIEKQNEGSSFWLVPGSNLNTVVSALRQAIEQAEKQEPVIGTKTWFEDGKMVTQHLYASDISQERVDETPKRKHEFECPRCGHCCQQKEWVGLATEEARKFYESDLSREELIHKIDEFLQEKNT